MCEQHDAPSAVLELGAPPRRGPVLERRKRRARLMRESMSSRSHEQPCMHARGSTAQQRNRSLPEKMEPVHGHRGSRHAARVQPRTHRLGRAALAAAGHAGDAHQPGAPARGRHGRQPATPRLRQHCPRAHLSAPQMQLASRPSMHAWGGCNPLGRRTGLQGCAAPAAAASGPPTGPTPVGLRASRPVS